MVAFLQQLPRMNAEEYRTLAVGTTSPHATGRADAGSGGVHGGLDRLLRALPRGGRRSPAQRRRAHPQRPARRILEDGAPELRGRRPAQRHHAADRRRASAEEIGKLAAYYAGLDPSAPAVDEAVDPEPIARGGMLAAVGDRSRGVPAATPATRRARRRTTRAWPARTNATSPASSRSGGAAAAEATRRAASWRRSPTA